MAFNSTIHVQTTIGPECLATIANALTELGCDPRSMSDLVATGLAMLADIFVDNGYPAYTEPQVIDEILDNIGRNKRRRPNLRFKAIGKPKEEKIDPFGVVTRQQATEIFRSGRYGGHLAHKGDEIEVLPSVAEEGEFSAEAMREEEK